MFTAATTPAQFTRIAVRDAGSANTNPKRPGVQPPGSSSTTRSNRSGEEEIGRENCRQRADARPGKGVERSRRHAAVSMRQPRKERVCAAVRRPASRPSTVNAGKTAKATALPWLPWWPHAETPLTPAISPAHVPRRAPAAEMVGDGMFRCQQGRKARTSTAPYSQTMENGAAKTEARNAFKQVGEASQMRGPAASAALTPDSKTRPRLQNHV